MYSSAIENVGKSLGLQYNTDENLAFGLYNNFNISILLNSQNDMHCISFSVKSAQELDPNFARELSEVNKLLIERRLNDYSVVVILNKNITSDSQLDYLRNILDTITTLLSQYNFVTCCENCGAEFPIELYSVNGSPYYLCQDCNFNLNQAVESAKATEDSKGNNMFLGIIGSILGSLIGVILWVIVGQLGFISTIVSFVLGICAMKGYKLFAGRLDKKGIVIGSIITIIMIFVSNYLTYSIDLLTAAKDFDVSYSFFDAVFDLPYFFSESEIRVAFFKDLGISYLFTVLTLIGICKEQYTKNNITTCVKPITGRY